MRTILSQSQRDALAFKLAEITARAPEKKETLRILRLRVGQVEKVYGANLSTYGKLIEMIGADVVFLMEDVIGPQTAVMVRAAHAQDIPALILPYTIADQSEAVESLAQSPRFHLFSDFNWLGLFWSWKYIRRHKGRFLLRLPYQMTRAHIVAGYTPRDPFLMNDSEADVVVMESERLLDYHRALGFGRDQLRLIGSLYEDEMFRRRKDQANFYSELCEQHRLDSSKPLIVLSAPPNQLKPGAREGDYDSYEVLCTDLAKTLIQKSESHNILVCMHPNSRDQAHLFEDLGLRVHPGDMMEIVPLARIFIAFASATLRWAVASGVPAINYDVFRFNYAEFDECGSVLKVDDKASFEGVLDKLCGDKTFYGTIEAEQEKARQRWSMADGQSVPRMRALVEELIAKRSGGQKSRADRSLKALFFILRSSDCAEALRNALSLKRDAKIEPIFVFARGAKPDTPACRLDVERCEREGIKCVTLQGEPFAYSATTDA